jgi:hypothetical protein
VKYSVTVVMVSVVMVSFDILILPGSRIPYIRGLTVSLLYPI